MEKNTFLIYLDYEDQFNLLSNEELGLLLRAVMTYEKTGEIPKLEGMLKMAFSVMKTRLDRDAKKWEETKKKRSEAGKRGMANRWESNTNDITQITKDNNVIEDITQITNITDNVNDSVNVNDNVNVINNVNKKEIKKKKNKKEKVEEEKIHFAEFVTMTNAEYEKLVSTHSKEFADQCITKLDNYKGSSGKTYKNDYRAILSWVVGEVQKENANGKMAQKSYEERVAERNEILKENLKKRGLL